MTSGEMEGKVFFWTDGSSMENQVCWVLHWLWSLYVMIPWTP